MRLVEVAVVGAMAGHYDLLPPFSIREVEVLYHVLVESALTASQVFRALRKLYHPPRSFLAWGSPFQLLVATVLSAQCTDARVNLVTRDLFRALKKPQDYLSISQRRLESLIHSCGTFRVKAKHIRELCRKLVRDHGGRVPRTMGELMHLPGVGRKTAAIILYAAFGKSEGIAVDTHVFRLARRMRLSRGKAPECVEQDLMKLFPRSQWGRINALFISHGRAICTARNRQCGKCVFRKKCPSSLTEGKRDLFRE
jgi:endonuclease-3